MDENIDLRIEFLVDEEDDTESSEGSSGSEQDRSDNPESGDHSRHLEPSISYDTSLPTQHSYLGTDLNELSGRTVLDDDSCQTIPLLSLPGVVLIPGQTLPLQLNNPTTVSMMMNIINNDRTFGLINSRFSGRAFTNVLDSIGTTAEIRSFREEGDSYGGSMLRIKAEGRQRFEVLETRRQADGMIVGKVRILPEICLSYAGEGSRLPSLNKFLSVSPDAPPDALSGGCSKERICNQLLHRPSQRHNRFDFANYTPFPEFLYKLYDPHVLMKRIKHLLQSWNRALMGEFMPYDPREFSYWIAANLPLDDNQRLDLLKINEVSERLRHELAILEKCSVLSCRDCLVNIAHRDNIFSMSQQGPQGTYVNSNGYVHEAITVYKAHGLALRGRPSTEMSWFPGYAWTIAECQHCHSHMGWRFTAVDKSLKPNKFWALCRSSILNRITSSEDSSNVSV